MTTNGCSRSRVISRPCTTPRAAQTSRAASTAGTAGQPKSLSIPYAAITRFYDPSVQHLLQFNVAAGSEPAPPPPAPIEASGEADSEVKVVSLDQFRKK